MSTSVDYSLASSFAGGEGLVFEILLPAGLNCAPMGKMSVVSTEAEIVLASGQQLEFKEAVQDKHRVLVRLRARVGSSEGEKKEPTE